MVDIETTVRAQALNQAGFMTDADLRTRISSLRLHRKRQLNLTQEQRAVFLKMLVSVIKRLPAFSRAAIENEIFHHLVLLSSVSLSSENTGWHPGS